MNATMNLSETIKQIGMQTWMELGVAQTVGAPDALMLKLAAGRGGQQKTVEIKLTPADTYTVRVVTWNRKTYAIRELGRAVDVFAADLGATIRALVFAKAAA